MQTSVRDIQDATIVRVARVKVNVMGRLVNCRPQPERPKAEEPLFVTEMPKANGLTSKGGPEEVDEVLCHLCSEERWLHLRHRIRMGRWRQY